MSRAIPLLPPRAIQPVQSLSDCTSLHFTLFFFTMSVDITGTWRTGRYGPFTSENVSSVS